MNNKEIGKFLQEKRKSNEMTQADLAKKMNVTYQAVSRWETGESIPDIQTLSNLADLYKISIDEILQRDKPVSSDNDFENIQAIFLMLVIFVHAIGFGAFWTFIQFDLKPIGLLAYFIAIVASLFIQNLGFAVNDNKRRIDIVLYFITYIPLVVSIFLMALN